MTTQNVWHTEPERIVREGYESCAGAYSEARSPDSGPEVDGLLSVLPRGADVLDIGCGNGLPVTAALSAMARVTGVDLCGVQVEAARRLVPPARFIHRNIMDLTFEPRTFDAVVAFYSLFHIPRDAHPLLLERIALWLKPGGQLLMTLAESEEPGYTEPHFFGATMYWSHFAHEFYEHALQRIGFEIWSTGVVGHGYRSDLGIAAERHPWVLARLGVDAGVRRHGRAP